MLSVYITEASLVTAFVIVVGIDQYNSRSTSSSSASTVKLKLSKYREKQSEKKQPAPQHRNTSLPLPRLIVDGFIKSIDTFLDAVIIFALSIASAFLAGVAYGTNYSQGQSSLASMFTTFPALIIMRLSLLYDPSWSNRTYRYYLTTLLISSEVVAAILSIMRYSYDPNKESGSVKLLCQLPVQYRMHFGLSIAFLLCLVGALVHLVRVFANSKRLRRLDFRMEIGVMVATMCMMWAYLGIFAAKRIASTRRSSIDNEWGFGQSLALFTWAAPIITIVEPLRAEFCKFLSLCYIS